MRDTKVGMTEDTNFTTKNRFIEETKGSSPYEGWGTALKPSIENWTLVRKPLDNSSNQEYNLGITINKIALCLLQLNVLTAEKNSKLNQQEQNEDVNTAQWTVGKNINTLEDLFVLMDMLQSKSTESLNLNIVLSWLNILAGVWQLMNTATTKTELNLTTELKILKSLEWENILANITQVKSSQINGLSANVLDVVSLFNAIRLKLQDTLTTSAQENASSALLDPRVNMELWTLCRKPLSEKTVAENVLKWGTGGINIDGCRVEFISDKYGDRAFSNKSGIQTSEETHAQFHSKSKKEKQNLSAKKSMLKTLNQGRFPANLIHDGSDEVVSGFPESGGGKFSKSGNRTGGNCEYSVGINGRKDAPDNYGDSGSASRYFYCAKASKAERNKGLEGFEEKEHRGGGGRANEGYDENDPEQQRLKKAAAAYGAVKVKRANSHPTVKPIKLMQYLCRLITPKDGTVLDPYMGSGSTGIGAKLEGFNFIGIEKEEEYCKIAKARINRLRQKTLF